MRRIQEAREIDDPTEAMLILDHALLQIEEDSISSADRIEPLIRNHSITAEMATSLMTDTEYARNACRSLIAMAKVLFAGRDSSTLQLDQGPELDKEEMASIIHKDSE
jgi:phosphate:Na+ symporter